MTLPMSTVATKMYFNGGIPSFCGCNLDLLLFHGIALITACLGATQGAV